MTVDTMLTRRRLLEAGAALAAATALPAGAAFADDYPGNREIKIVAAFPAGSGADVFTRYFADNMRPFLGNPTMIVENKVGASGNIAANYVAKAKPDGYTIFIHAPSAIAGNMALFKNPGFDEKAFAILGSVCRLPFTVSVSANSPHKTLQELIAAVKAKGAKASYGTTAPTGQVAGAIMKKTLKLEAVEVPYRTAADTVNDLDSGAVDYVMYDPIFAMPRHRQGKLRVLAISAKERMSTAPDIPTMHESGVPGVDIVGWWGPAVPAGTPQAVKDKIADAFRKMAEKPETKKWLSNLGGDPWVVGPAEAQKRFLQDVKEWAGFIKIAGIEPKG
ncbi:MAG TPA: tripartite tricarboxylate transporter substrate binding protein [Xanthobacteraceae bacterium]|nr:tripartite tricarboxylate transporter substrate binding protein [Xanthobacteraceae bacterium]